TMSAPFGLDGRTVLVTGASSGLGLHFARTVAAAGATVVVAARRTERLQALVTELTAAGRRAVAVGVDVRDDRLVVAAFESAAALVGVVDVVVNNAGISVQHDALDVSPADWDDVVGTNLRGAWLVAQTAARALVAAQRPGRIVNIASIVGLR